jgi:hypothetical protein
MPAGQPKRFDSGEQLIALWNDFCAEIVEDGYKIAPTLTEFGKWLSVALNDTDRKTLYNALYKYFPEVKATVEGARADVVAQGTMLGKYQPSMSIFALKNWCGWTDRLETQNQNVNKNYDMSTLTDEQIDKILAEDATD